MKNKKISSTRASTLGGDDFFLERDQQLRWTQDVSGLMAMVLLILELFFLAGSLAGFITFSEALWVAAALVALVFCWWGARWKGWRWVAYIPVTAFLLIGINGTLMTGFLSAFTLFYAIAILMASILLGSRAGHGLLFCSILAYIICGAYKDGLSINTLVYIGTFSISMAGIAALQWYSHRRTLQALRASSEKEAHLRRLTDNTSDLITELDAQGIIRYVSPSYKQTMGYEPDSLLGTNGFELTHPDDIAAAYETAQQAVANHQVGKLQLRSRCADGHYIYAEVSGTPLYDDQGHHKGFVLSGRDITQQKLAEQSLQESEQKFRAIVESLPMGVHMYTLEEDHRLVFSGYNPMANTILGIDHAPLLGKTIEEAFPGLVETDVPDAYRKVARSGEVWHNEQIDYDKDGIRGAFNVWTFQSTPSHTVTVFEDITDRIRAAKALRDSEEKFSTAFQTSPDALNINRLEDGVFMEINEGFTQVTGYSREEVLGKSSLEINIWADPTNRAQMVAGLRTNGLVTNMEARFRGKNGNIAIGLMSARVIEVQGEKCILSITRPITEWIQTQMELREREAELREAHTKLELAYDATLRGWARALELREHETANHSRRVVELTMQVACALGICGDGLQNIQRGALLHDIGKMGIPDGILLKPGPLTEEEWAIMRKHTEYAKTMLSEVSYLHPCLAIPYSHHEHWDGTGYPLNLRGEEIPLPARIFSVVDVFDALTHERPYRAAWPAEQAKSYLIEQSGKYFDPQVVEVFLQYV